ncbi:ABC-type Na+ efflux pump permease subunit [Natronocella acetinitrilica]|uniref:ABC-type Na+ efflux pump permease subunit n=1 Tax=Natronocella acetinitrilica TaxID=414046 RepID=A0AAE3KBA2_9GAMM|nr:hypothetical protein [Natronocella acetinitrilica]MCP1674421.1 ABC-type Na+ efflux pump permease subunit [Natronocella acetinitrilica]
MKVLYFIAILLLGLLQFLAIWTGIEVFLGIHAIFALILALFLTGIPLIGTLAGVYGAVAGWGWSLVAALTLFFGLFALILVLFALDRADGHRG